MISDNPFAASIAICQAVQKGDLLQDQAFPKIEALLCNYTKNTLENSLVEFAEKNFDLSKCELRRVTTRAYYGIDATTKVNKVLLKTFAIPSKNFVPEILGLEFLKRVEGVTAPAILALGKCYHQNVCHFLLAETLVLGKSIFEYYEEVERHPTGSHERALAMSHLKASVAACGAGLAKLHYTPNPQWQSFPEEIKSVMKIDLERAIQKIDLIPGTGIKTVDLIKLVESVFQKVEQHSFLVGYTHGDIKLIHTFYHLESGQFSLVDPPNLMKSVDLNGDPKGIPVRDYYQFILSLIFNQVGYYLDYKDNVQSRVFISATEVEVLKEIFKNAYQKTGGTIPNPLEEQILLLRHILQFISQYWRVDILEPEKTRFENLVQIGFKCLREQIEQLKSN